MGWKKIMFLGGLLGGILLLLFGYVAFMYLDLTATVTGGLLTNLGSALSNLSALGLPAFLNTIIGVVLGGAMLVIFPLDWILLYRAEDTVTALNIPAFLAIILPWILAGVLLALIMAHDAKEGFLCGMALAVYPIILGIIGAVLLSGLEGIGPIIDGAVTGLVGRSLILAILTACLEGGALAGVFGALIGALKYKPGAVKASKKSKKGASESREDAGKKDEFVVDFEN